MPDSRETNWAEAPAERSAGPRPEQRPAEVAPTGAQSETVGRTAPEASVPSEQSEPRRRRPRAHDEGPSEGEAASGEAEASEVTGEEPTAVPPPTTTTTTTPPPRAGRLDIDDL